LSGFIGSSGGAYDTDELKMETSWNVGVRAYKKILGNTLSGNFSRVKTSPDLGESSKTASEDRSVTLSLLDSFYTSERQSRIDYEKAVATLEDTRRNTEIELREGFFNYQKALFQVKSALQDVAYRQKQVDVTRQKEKLAMAESSEVISAESALTEAQIGYEEALSFYYISLAAIEKAAGTVILEN
jgi:outer membrane protein TolC